MPLFLLFVIVPICELFILFQLAGVIGFLPTLLIVICTAFIGVNLIKRQGMKTYSEFYAQSSQGEIPTGPMFDGACLLIAGAFLLTPGLITDVLGFALLTPAIRKGLGKFILSNIPFAGTVQGFTVYSSATSQRDRKQDSNVIDAEFEELDSDKNSPPRA